MNALSPEIIGGLVRSAIQALGGLLVALGVTDDSKVALIAGAIGVIGSTAWSIWQKVQAERDRKTAYVTGLVTPPPEATVGPVVVPTIEEMRVIAPPATP
jgi:hypothetical protein